MEITIKIDCETINDFYAHLTVLRKQVKSECKKQKLDPLNDEFKVGKNLFYDDNCYGTHYVKIQEEKI